MGLEETDRYQSPEEVCGRITPSLRKDCDLIAPKTQPHPQTSEVGRFLRKRQCKGSQIAAATDHRRNRSPQKRITAVPNRSEIAPYLRSSSD